MYGSYLVLYRFFEQMHDLQFLRDSLEGAEFVLELLRDKVPARVTIIHLYDINSKEFVVVKARAPNPAGVLGTRSKEGSSLVGVAAKQGRGMMVTDAKTDQRWSREYYSGAGHEPQRIMVVPVRHGQRYLGALELADHVDDMAFTDTELHAVSYIAEQFGEFVAERGVTLKPGADSTGGHPVLDVSKRR